MPETPVVQSRSRRMTLDSASTAGMAVERGAVERGAVEREVGMGDGETVVSVAVADARLPEVREGVDVELTCEPRV